MTIKTSSDLKAAVIEAGTAPYFFSTQNMRHAGDTMRNFGVRLVQVELSSGDRNKVTITAYELYRKAPVKGGNQGSFYFHPVTYKRVYPL